MKLANYSFILISLFLIGCKKDFAQGSANSEGIQLSGKKWKLISEWVTMPDEKYDNQTFKPACKLDDLFVYNVDSTFLLLPGTTKCKINEPDTSIVGIWYFIEFGNKIRFDDPGGNPPVVFDVIEFSNTKFIIQIKDEIPGMKMTRELTYSTNF